jgi:predicted TIM-barrel fold metal-dependent hydrolase
MEFLRSDAVAAIRGRIDHPIVDADGHHVEPIPIVGDFVGQIGGAEAKRRFLAGRVVGAPPPAELLRSAPVKQIPRNRYGFPAANTLDLATAMVPELMYRRLDELGIDFALVYSTMALGVLTSADDELRPVVARALNSYYLEAFAGLRDRLEPVATIPMATPEEALAELDFAVGDKGMKVVVMGGVIPRLATIGSSRIVDWIDTLGHDSLYDYDPVWERCVQLGVSPTFHATGSGFGTRLSRTNTVYNHIGHFACAQEGVCRSLLMGGVPRRFPSLRFAFLEGGVGWGAQLYADVLGHFEKRNRGALERYNPARIDLGLFEELVVSYGKRGPIGSRRADVIEATSRQAQDAKDAEPPDDFADSKITRPEDIVDIFTSQYYFGCEADDPITALAFDRRKLPYQQRLNAMFSSDVGHYDVPDMRQVLPEAWEQVEDGRVSVEDFRDFAFANAVRMLSSGRPDFFDETAIADAANPVSRLGREDAKV